MIVILSAAKNLVIAGCESNNEILRYAQNDTFF